jgi:hypothetical protein
MTASPVTTLSVSPGYGPGIAVVEWKVDPALPPGPAVHVYRSDDNGFTWTRLTQDGPVTDRDFYIDTALPKQPGDVTHLYRLVLMWTAPGPDYRDTEPVSSYGRLRRHEYGVVRGMIRREFIRMRRNGVPAWHTTPLQSGEPCGGYDEETRQFTEPPCEDDDCYGQPYKGGFASPMLTWVEFKRTPVIHQTEYTETGRMDARSGNARMFAWPRPRTGDLVVVAATDERYAVGPRVQGFLFKALVPVAWDVDLVLLDRKDPRQRFKVPATPGNILHGDLL